MLRSLDHVGLRARRRLVLAPLLVVGVPEELHAGRQHGHLLLPPAGLAVAPPPAAPAAVVVPRRRLLRRGLVLRVLLPPAGLRGGAGHGPGGRGGRRRRALPRVLHWGAPGRKGRASLCVYLQRIHVSAQVPRTIPIRVRTLFPLSLFGGLNYCHYYSHYFYHDDLLSLGMMIRRLIFLLFWSRECPIWTGVAAVSAASFADHQQFMKLGLGLHPPSAPTSPRRATFLAVGIKSGPSHRHI